MRVENNQKHCLPVGGRAGGSTGYGRLAALAKTTRKHWNQWKSIKQWKALKKYWKTKKAMKNYAKQWTQDFEHKNYIKLMNGKNKDMQSYEKQ